jgi:Cu/Ag efflux pump CusA
MNTLIRWSIEHRLLVIAAALLLVVFGIEVTRRMPVDVFPDLTAPTVTVITEAHGLAPEEVETLVTFPLETALNGASGLRRVRSASGVGISIVWAEFDWGTDIHMARQVVNEKLQLAGPQLPQDLPPPTMAPVSSVMGEILFLALRPEVLAPEGPDRDAQLMALRTAADWTLRKRLLAVAGVSQVIPIGGAVKEYQVLVRPEALTALNLTFDEVTHALRTTNQNAAGGFHVEGGQEYLLRAVGRARSLDDIAATPVAVRGGIPITIRQVAEVRAGPHDARWPRGRDRRTGRRRDHRRRERLPPAARERRATGRRTEAGAPGHLGREQRDPQLGRLRDGHHLHGVRAVAVLAGHRGSLLPAARHRVHRLKLFGDDLDRLRGLAEAVKQVAEGTPGAVDVSIEQQIDIPVLEVRADREAAARYGLTTGALVESVEAGLTGTKVGDLLEGQRTVDLVARYDASVRESRDALLSTPFDTPVGVRVPLKAVAELVRTTSPNTIAREGVQRKMVVQANVAGRDLVSVVDDLRARIDAQVSMPEGYFVVYGGQFESAAEATRTIAMLSVAVVAGIFLLLVVAFGSARNAVMTLINLPLALIGGVAAIAATSAVVSIASLVGFITLFGIATRNGILLVSHFEHLRTHEGADVNEAVWRGSLERLSPVLMTALCAGLALIPLVIAGGEPGNEIQAPMAVVILGGLLSSTALNLMVVPVLYARFGSGAASR